MRAARKKRLYLIALMLLGVGVAVMLALNAFNKNLMYFYSPSEVISGKAPGDRAFRIGGLVTDGSVQRLPNGLTTRFILTDQQKTVSVEYTGILDHRPEGKDGIWVIDGKSFSVTDEVDLDEDHGPITAGACVELEMDDGVVKEIASEAMDKCPPEQK